MLSLDVIIVVHRFEILTLLVNNLLQLRITEV